MNIVGMGLWTAFCYLASLADVQMDDRIMDEINNSCKLQMVHDAWLIQERPASILHAGVAGSLVSKCVAEQGWVRWTQEERRGWVMMWRLEWSWFILTYAEDIIVVVVQIACWFILYHMHRTAAPVKISDHLSSRHNLPRLSARLTLNYTPSRITFKAEYSCWSERFHNAFTADYPVFNPTISARSG